jgi:enoyl-CoA hydratase/carnithine racemase
MPYQEILYQVSNRVATLTLNRPDKLNAWTMRMEEEVGAALGEAAADDGVRVIILTGAGRGFCAGADMSLLSAVVKDGGASGERLRPGSGPDVQGDADVRADFRRRHVWLVSIPKPIIAAINGPAVGLGFILPIYCDLRFASDQARFSTVFARRGLVAEYGMAWMLPRLIGVGNTVELLFSARTIDAAEALRIGLVQRVLPQEGFLEAVQAYAAELASTVSPRSLRVMKYQIYEAQFQTLGEAVDLAGDEMVGSFASEDFREGVAHFLEKRAPAFTGR